MVSFLYMFGLQAIQSAKKLNCSLQRSLFSIPFMCLISTSLKPPIKTNSSNSSFTPAAAFHNGSFIMVCSLLNRCDFSRAKLEPRTLSGKFFNNKLNVSNFRKQIACKLLTSSKTSCKFEEGVNGVRSLGNTSAPLCCTCTFRNELPWYALKRVEWTWKVLISRIAEKVV